MEQYNINQDIADQQAVYLKFFLIITFFLGLVFLAVFARTGLPEIRPWMCLLITLVSSFELRRREYIRASAWTYLIGLLTTFAISLAAFGPSTIIYTLITLTAMMGALLVNRNNMVRFAVVCCLAMVVLTAFQTNFPTSIGLTFNPCLLCIAMVSLIYTIIGNVLETVHWATDIQQKDTRRAEMFYEQKEQLSDVLRQLTHAKSVLELTNQKLKEAQQHTEEVSKAKSVFLSNMSHELRTPLNIVIGYTSTILDMPQLYDNISLPPRYRADIKLIKENGYYLLGLINDVLDLSKIEAGKLELHCTTVDLLTLFPGIMATCIGLIKEKPIQLRPDYPDDLPPVWADPIRVRQIILNLMSNAIKFTTTGSVTLQARLEDQSVRIAVIDTGIGIPEKALAHIFDRFEQAEHDTDKQYGGTGLGLDISKRLTAMHGSDLTVRSIIGQGSTFAFSLALSAEPLFQGDSASSTDESTELLTPPAHVTVRSILLVEDEANLREMIHRALSTEGYVVVDAQDGGQALDMAQGLMPDLIITDIYLPTMNGWELLEKLKGNSGTASIPVVVCTASDDES